MSRPLKTFDNAEVQSFVDQFYCVADLCAEYPTIDDIFTALLAAKTEGDSSRRSLNRKTLFMILSRCPVIDTQAVAALLDQGAASRTRRAYASLARTASIFIHRFLDRLSARDAVELRQPI